MSESLSLKTPSHSEALQRAQKARDNIKDIIIKTSMVGTKSGSARCGSDLYLKLENNQVTGSFKIRGALNKLLSLSDSERKQGVIASSAGNHSQGVAYSAKVLNIDAKIVMPETTPLVKIAGTKGYGAEVVLHGQIFDEAFELAQSLSAKEGRVFIHAYQDDEIISGTATLALEIFEQVKEIDTLIVPVGGGGLISGMAMVTKAMNPSCRVIGVQAENTARMAKLFQGKEFSAAGFLPSIADGISIKNPSQEMYKKYISKFVDEMVTVTEDELAEAIVFLLERKKTMAEGSGACSLAAAFSGKVKLGQKTCALISGGNVDINTISKVIQRGLSESGRLANLSVVVDDSPGNLAEIANIIGDHKANILEVSHSRNTMGLGLRQTRINFLLETTDEEHIARIQKALDGI